MVTPPVVLAIAGTDSGGGAGLAADLATYAALGVHGASVVAAVTAQDTTGVHAIHPLPLSVVAEQLDTVLDDLAPAAVKTGMLGTAEVALLVAGWCAATPQRPLVVDPVLRATTGAELADAALVDAYRHHLLPVATVVTPNAAEARALLGLTADDTMPAWELAGLLADKLDGPAVLLTGGPTVESGALGGSTSGGAPAAATCTDWLAVRGETPLALQHPAVATSNDHGTGCTHASAVAAYLAQGDDLAAAATQAAAFVARQLSTSQQWRLGRGRGPIAHTTTTIPTEEIR